MMRCSSEVHANLCFMNTSIEFVFAKEKVQYRSTLLPCQLVQKDWDGHQFDATAGRVVIAFEALESILQNK